MQSSYCAHDKLKAMYTKSNTLKCIYVSVSSYLVSRIISSFDLGKPQYHNPLVQKCLYLRNRCREENKILPRVNRMFQKGPMLIERIFLLFIVSEMCM